MKESIQLFHDMWIVTTAFAVAGSLMVWWGLRQVFRDVTLCGRVGVVFLGRAFEVACIEVAWLLWEPFTFWHESVKNVGRLVELATLVWLVNYLLTLHKRNNGNGK